MFAEPIEKETLKEKFVVSYVINKKEIEFDPEQAGIGDNTFYYLARNYYYRKEAANFLEKTAVTIPVKAVEWRLKKIVYTDSVLPGGDTSIVARLTL